MSSRREFLRALAAAPFAVAAPSLAAGASSNRLLVLVFLYGGNDPWSAGQYELGLAADSYKLTLPGGNHGTSLGALQEPVKSKALEVVRRWAGVAAMNVQGLAAEQQDEPRRRLRP